MNNVHPTQKQLIKVGNKLHPITHTFIVKEKLEARPPPVDYLLECYNIAYMPPFLPIGTHQTVEFHAKLIFAYIGSDIANSAGQCLHQTADSPCHRKEQLLQRSGQTRLGGQ